MHTVLLLAVLARAPLFIPDSAWSKPAEVRAEEQRRSLERLHAEQQASEAKGHGVAAPPPPARRALEDRRFAISLGAGALIGWPSLEVEVLPVHHLAGYVCGEASILAPGYGIQAGVRVRPMEGLIGPWFDVHVRHSRFTNPFFSIHEELSPGAAIGFSLQTRAGFLLSAGLGASFLVMTSQTRWGVGIADAGFLAVPFLAAVTSRQYGAQPEFKLQVGWAL